MNEDAGIVIVGGVCEPAEGVDEAGDLGVLRRGVMDDAGDGVGDDDLVIVPETSDEDIVQGVLGDGAVEGKDELRGGEGGKVLLFPDEAHGPVVVDHHLLGGVPWASPFSEHLFGNIAGGRRPPFEDTGGDGLLHEGVDDVGLFKSDGLVVNPEGAREVLVEDVEAARDLGGGGRVFEGEGGERERPRSAWREASSSPPRPSSSSPDRGCGR